MKNEFTFLQLLGSSNTRQFVVPELQRDYVWKKQNWQPLAEQLLEAYQGYASEAVGEADDAYRNWLRQQNLGYNLGFLYAYHDSNYPGHCFLIDGQQRLTTLLLLLLAAAVQGGRTDHFRRHFLTSNNEPYLAYRVREAAQEFLVRFVGHLLAGKADDTLNVGHLERPHWFYAYYMHDATIRRLLKNYRGLRQWLATVLPTQADGDTTTASGFYDYLCEAVRFWYFDTAQSDQGEELYLSLNASAEPLTSSENLKAQLLADLPQAEKNSWGEQFEEWEQFFWTHRNRKAGHDASQGLNEFFRWVAVCELLTRLPALATVPAFVKELVRGDGKNNEVRDAMLLVRAEISSEPKEAARSLVIRIAQYVGALQYLYDEWMPQAATLAIDAWGMTPAAVARVLPATSWLSPTGKLTAVDCLRLLPVLAYLVGRGESEWATATRGKELFRVVRYFYNLSRVENVGKDSDSFAVNAVHNAHLLAAFSSDVADLPSLPTMSFTLDQEVTKLALFKRDTDGHHSREATEALCWALEDEPYNKGEIKHLCDDLSTLTHFELEIIAAKYRLVFGGNSNLKQLQTLLLYYGPCYKQDSNNSYYVNYKFDNWHYSVRQAGFKLFFSEIGTSGDAVASLYKARKRAILTELKTVEIANVGQFHEQLLTIAALFDEAIQPADAEAGCAIWSSGNYAGWYYYVDLPLTIQPLFYAHRDLLNASGGFGYASSNTVHLFDELRKHIEGADIASLVAATLEAVEQPN